MSVMNGREVAREKQRCPGLRVRHRTGLPWSRFRCIAISHDGSLLVK